MQVKQAYNKLVNSMTGSYELPLAYVGLMTICFLLGIHVFALTCSLTSLYLGHLVLLGQYQKCILFLPSLLKKDLIAEANEITMFWRESTLDSRIFLPATIELVMMIMSWILSICIAGISLVRIAMSLALRAVTFMELTCNSFMTTLSDQI